MTIEGLSRNGPPLTEQQARLCAYNLAELRTYKPKPKRATPQQDYKAIPLMLPVRMTSSAPPPKSSLIS